MPGYCWADGQSSNLASTIRDSIHRVPVILGRSIDIRSPERTLEQNIEPVDHRQADEQHDDSLEIVNRMDRGVGIEHERDDAVLDGDLGDSHGAPRL